MKQKAERIQFSNHAIRDRIERMTMIATTIGFGEIVIEFADKNEYGNTWHCLTNTGVCIVKTEDKQKIITMFCISIPRLEAYYLNRVGQKPPYSLWVAVRNNEKKRPYLFTSRGK